MSAIKDQCAGLWQGINQRALFKALKACRPAGSAQSIGQNITVHAITAGNIGLTHGGNGGGGIDILMMARKCRSRQVKNFVADP